MIKDVIIATIQGEEHLGDNLKKQCIDYLEQYCERTDCSGRLGNSKKVEELIKENEKLNHYKLLYQKVKERNDKAIEYVEWYINDNKDFYKNKNIGLTLSETDGLLVILKGNNEE